MAMTVQVDVRPSGRISVAVNTDAGYSPDVMDDLVNRTVTLVAETVAAVTAEWAADGPVE